MNEIDDNNLKSSENVTIVNSCIESIESTASTFRDDVDVKDLQLQNNKHELKQQEQLHNLEEEIEMELHCKSIANDNEVKAILHEIGEIYSERITEIDEKAAGDHELKCITYKEWVEMLIGLIHHMFDNLKELELNAKNAILHLEKKLNESKILDNVDLNIVNLKNDFLNLLTLIHRAIEQGNWDTTGLDFKTITEEQIFGNGIQSNTLDIRKLNSQINENGHEIDKLLSENDILKTEIEKKDLLISNLQSKLNRLENDKKCECASGNENNNNNSVENNEIVERLKNCLSEQEQILVKELKKNEVLTTELEVVRGKCERKEKVIESMKSLAFEVADKHDQIQQQKAHLLTMEEELQQAHKKIQFKDSVIKDLRRDLKNHLTKQLQSYDSDMSKGQTSYNVLSKPNLLSHDANSCLKEELAHFNKQDVNKLIELEESKLIACQAEEDVNLKILLLELDELCQLKQCVGDDSLKELEKMIGRFQARIKNVVLDQTSMKKKLQHMRDILIKIVNGQYECKNVNNDRMDCNYLSQDENNFENGLLRRVNQKICDLENELNSVKNQVRELHLEIERSHSNANSKNRTLEKQRKVLKHLTEYLGKISGVSIDFETVFQESNENEHADLFAKNILCDGLENLIQKKEDTITKLQEYNQQIENILKCREALLSEINNTLKDKEEIIQRLNENLRYNNESIKVLSHEKDCLNEEIQKLSESLKNSDIKKLLNEIEELQTLNKNQVTTISNLMEALENIKREHHTSGNVFQSNEKLSNQQNNNTDASNIVDNKQNSSGSLWGWIRGNTYDV